MHYKSIAALMLCFTAVALLNGESFTVSSNPFTFPSITKTITQQKIVKQPFFRHGGLRPGANSLILSWDLPGASADKQGSITIYSLLGRVVTQIPIYKNHGNATWHLGSSHCRSGIYIARISYGTQLRNLKIALWK